MATEACILRSLLDRAPSLQFFSSPSGFLFTHLWCLPGSHGCLSMPPLNWIWFQVPALPVYVLSFVLSHQEGKSVVRHLDLAVDFSNTMQSTERHIDW